MRLSRTVLAAVAATFIPALASAQVNYTGSKEVGAFLGYNIVSENTELGNATSKDDIPVSALMLGVRGALHLTEHIAGELEFKITPTHLKSDDSRASTIFGFRAGALYHLNIGPAHRLRPFVWAGLGAEVLQTEAKGKEGDANFIEQDPDIAYIGGLGVKYQILDTLLARLDLRAIGAPRREDSLLTANWEFSIGFAWLLDAKATDSDNDGIPDKTDTCPKKPEDKDGFKDADGCPDPDNDADGVPDSSDGCANEAEDKDGFEDADGCPDPDNDKDGFLDAKDQCPNKAEDKDGFDDKDGCPDPDNDKDGILDTDDKCPNEAGIAEEAGCPVKDRDKDGIPDNKDKCPNKPETFNGIKDEDGCPDKKALVIITKTEIKILQKVYFATGKAEIKKESFKLLNTVAAVLKSQPQITLIVVEGHTDDTGNDKLNLKLSGDRAQSVVTYLIDKGLMAERLQARGYGETAPMCTQWQDLQTAWKKTRGRARKKAKKALDACREQNRRVQFKIGAINGKAISASETAVIEKKETVPQK